MLQITTPSLEQALDRAIALHRAGQFAPADALYQQILAINPRHTEALRWRGILVAQTGNPDVGITMLQQAAALAPNSAAILNDLGSACLNSNRVREAIEIYEKALAIDPQFAECHNNIGIAFYRAGNPAAAIASFQKAIDLRPNFADPRNGLGMTLKDTGRIDEAITALRGAIEINPNYAEALNNLGNALKTSQKFAEAIAAYKRAIAIRPDFAESHNNLANTYKDCGRMEEAIATYRNAIAIRPGWAEIRNNLANALKDSGRMEEAAIIYREALKIRPTLTAVHSNLLYLLQYVPNQDPKAIYEEHRRWDEIHAAPFRSEWREHLNDRSPDRRLRVGYVSPDFRTHSVSYFLESLLAAHDPAQVEIFCYADVARPDAVTARLQKLAHQWRSTFGLPDAAVADTIRNDQIDILVDLCGHTAANRLRVFARKPAPIQITYLGYPATTGLSAIDYRLTDPFTDPPLPDNARDPYHSEELIRLPETFICYRASENAPDVAPPPSATIGKITFGSFNAMPKINPLLIASWSALMQRFPDSRFILKTRSLGDAVQQKRLLALFAEHHIAPERIELLEKLTSYADHLAYYSRIDIALDTFPYHGTTTTCEALWMGVPVVTLVGPQHLSRVGVSILQNVGLPELIAQTPEQYLDIAAALAIDLPRLRQLRSSLRDRLRNSPLMNAPHFAKNVEAAYRSMWHRWCNSRASHA